MSSLTATPIGKYTKPVSGTCGCTGFLRLGRFAAAAVFAGPCAFHRRSKLRRLGSFHQVPKSYAPEEVSVSIADASSQERDEAQMIAAILAGDRDLYHPLIQPYELSVYRIAMSFVKNETEAEDVAQEAFLKALHNLANFRAESKFSTWLIGITLNEARRWLRR